MLTSKKCLLPRKFRQMSLRWCPRHSAHAASFSGYPKWDVIPSRNDALHASDYKVFKDLISKASSTSSLTLQFRVVDRKEVIMSNRYLPESRAINADRNYSGNVGNYIWEYGATNLLNPFTTRLVESKDWKTSVFILAQANLSL